jgi:hypothetical protein
VPVNLKQKIIAGEYIDLALLLINSQASLSDKHTVIVSHGAAGASCVPREGEVTVDICWFARFPVTIVDTCTMCVTVGELIERTKEAGIPPLL